MYCVHQLLIGLPNIHIFTLIGILQAAPDGKLSSTITSSLLEKYWRDSFFFASEIKKERWSKKLVILYDPWLTPIQLSYSSLGSFTIYKHTHTHIHMHMDIHIHIYIPSYFVDYWMGNFLNINYKVCIYSVRKWKEKRRHRQSGTCEK